MKKSYVVVGMQFGDEGKGACVDYLCRTSRADLVVRFGGGHQCGHTVRSGDLRHIFSSFGSGSFVNVPTLLTSDVVVNFGVIERELVELRAIGVSPTLFVNSSCLVTTPIHVIWNRSLESRNGHGSCGVGIGAARSYWLSYGKDAVFASDSLSDIRDKLSLMKQRIRNEIYSGPSEYADVFDSANPDEIAKNIYNSRLKCETSRFVRVGWFEYLIDKSDVVVFEGHQGVLLDEIHGFHPYTTWSDTTPKRAAELSSMYSVKPTVVGCIRMMTTRHGNGPLPTEDPSVSMDLGCPDSYSGKIRYGHLDLELLRYSFKVCPVDEFHASWCDRYSGKVCTHYRYRPPVYVRHPVINPNVPTSNTLMISGDSETSRINFDLMSTKDVVKEIGKMATVSCFSYGPNHYDRRRELN